MFILQLKNKNRYLKVTRDRVYLINDLQQASIYRKNVELGYKLYKLINRDLNVNLKEDFIKLPVKLEYDDSHKQKEI